MNLRLAYLAAPALALTYGVLRIIDGLDGVRGPGIAWTTGHIAFVLAIFFWVRLLPDLRRKLNGGPVPTSFTAVTIAGAAALTTQFVIDIVVGLRATDHAAMSAQFDRVQSIPGVMPVVYIAGPSLFYLGLSALVIHLAVTGRVRPWVPILFSVGTLLPLVDKDLLPLGALCLLAASIPPASVPPATVPPAASVPPAGRLTSAKARTRQESTR